MVEESGLFAGLVVGGIDTRPQQEGDVDIGTQAAVGENNIAGKEESEELAEQFAFMHAQGTLGPVRSKAPLARQKQPTSLATGKPQPFFWLDGCGKAL